MEGCSASLLQRKPPRQLPSPPSTHFCSTGSWPGGSRRRVPRPWQRRDENTASLREEPAGGTTHFTGGSRARRRRVARGPRHRRSCSPVPAAHLRRPQKADVQRDKRGCASPPQPVPPAPQAVPIWAAAAGGPPRGRCGGTGGSQPPSCCRTAAGPRLRVLVTWVRHPDCHL